MLRRFTSRLGLIAIAVSVGCGGSGSGCAGLKPLPSMPAPYGLPASQLIEGGAQLRLTKQGLDKVQGAIPGLISGMLTDSGVCAIADKDYSIGPIDIFEFCGDKTCPGHTAGCGAFFYLDTKDEPSNFTPPLPKPAAGVEDGKLGVTVTVGQASPTAPVLFTIHIKMDIAIPIALDVFGTGSCTILARTDHAVDHTAAPLDITATVELGIDKTTGELTMNVASGNAIVVNNAGGLALDGQSGACVTAAILSPLTSLIDDAIQSFIGTFLINNIFKGVINNLIQTLLPKPLGIAGTVSTGALLSSFGAPADAALETFIVPGGYVQALGSGLTIGVLSGMNSDRDQSTRDDAHVSEPSLCVPARPTPVLSSPPWMLPVSPTSNNYHLDPAGAFAGMPDPVDSTGMPRDLAMGISRTFMDLAGFHIYNSGTLCLNIDGTAIPQLNAGTLSVIVGSLGNIVEDKGAPLKLVLRPQVPPIFTFGAGTMMDPLINVGLTDLRIDFYAWIEERFARIFTLSIDMNLGLNLTVTKNAAGQPSVQPMLVGLDAANVKITVLNTDLLAEDPADLAAVFPSLVNIAASAAAGAIPAIAIPNFAGFGLSDFEISKVQTTEDDFLGVFATIDVTATEHRMDWSDPEHPKMAGELDTQARWTKITVPTQADLRAAFHNLGAAPPHGSPLRPRITIAVASTLDGAAKLGSEHSYRVDGGLWHAWQVGAEFVADDTEFFLQGHHAIDVRTRLPGDFWTEDSTPAHLDVVIDSVPPDVVAQPIDGGLSATATDIVTPANKLVYAWRQVGDKSELQWSSNLSIPTATLQSLASQGVAKIELLAKDETQNIGVVPFDLSTLASYKPAAVPRAGGCNASSSAPMAGELALMLLVGAIGFARRRRALLAAVPVILLASACDHSTTCKVDDDCSRTMCIAGQIARCNAPKCECTNDIQFGDSGRYATMTLINGHAYVAAYNETYGDLMIGHVTPPARVTNWQYVDGVPNNAPDTPISRVRGGVSGEGEDVGRYASIAATPWDDPEIAYYDKTAGALKLARFGAVEWRGYTVDVGTGSPDAGGDMIGRWASLTLDKNGIPGIAYSAVVQQGMDKMPEGQLRWAQASTPYPKLPSDWTVTILDRRALGPIVTSPADMASSAAPTDQLLPASIAIMMSAARKSDDTPAIVYYDEVKGDLRYVEYDSAEKKWGLPEVIDGADTNGVDNGDVGQYPSLVFDEGGIGHISYVDTSRTNLMYIDTINRMRQIVDDGYRPMDEMTNDGLASPVYHFIGDSSSIQLIGVVPVISYQDATTLQTRFAQANGDGTWKLQSLAGHTMPFVGAYGFYNTMRTNGGHAIISTYAIDQQSTPEQFFVDVLDVNLGLLQ